MSRDNTYAFETIPVQPGTQQNEEFIQVSRRHEGFICDGCMYDPKFCGSEKRNRCRQTIHENQPGSYEDI